MVAKGLRMAPKFRLSGWEKRLGKEKLEFDPEKGEPSRGGGRSGAARRTGGSRQTVGSADEITNDGVCGCCAGARTGAGEEALAGAGEGACAGKSSSILVRGTKSASWRLKLVELNSSSGRVALVSRTA